MFDNYKLNVIFYIFRQFQQKLMIKIYNLKKFYNKPIIFKNNSIFYLKNKKSFTKMKLM